MKISRQIKNMLINLTVIALFCLSFPRLETAAATVSDYGGTVFAKDAGQTDVTARIVVEDSGQEEPPQDGETDGQTDGTAGGNADGTGETGREIDAVRTGDALSAAILPVCATAVLGAAAILLLKVKNSREK